MTYMDHIPAQRRAASYLQHVMKGVPKRTLHGSRTLKGAISQPTPAPTFLISCSNKSMPSTVTTLQVSTRPLSKQRATNESHTSFIAMSHKDPSSA